MTKKDEKALNLINQMLEYAKVDDEEHKIQMIAEGKGRNAVGESWVIFHLKALKEILEDSKEDE